MVIVSYFWTLTNHILKGENTNKEWTRQGFWDWLRVLKQKRDVVCLLLMCKRVDIFYGGYIKWLLPFLKGMLSTLFSFWMVCSNTQNRSATVEWLDYWLKLNFWDLNQSLDKLDTRNANEMFALYEKHHKVAKTHVISIRRNIVMHLNSIQSWT